MPPIQPRRPQAGQRPPIRPRKKTPPIILALIIIVPLAGIGVYAFRVLVLHRQPTQATQPALADPNVEIQELENQFRLLEEEARKTYRLGIDSPQFRTQAQTVIAQLNSWMDRFDRIFSAIKGPDGDWPAEYQGYSQMKSRAGQLKSDLIRAAGL